MNTLSSYCKVIAMGFFVLVCLLTDGCCKQPKDSSKKSGQVLRLATTTTTIESGLMDWVIPIFEKRYGISVDIKMAGTGATIDAAREGKADVILVHSREDEDKFVTDGCGINRRDVMYNDFIILGPPDDPLHLKKEPDVLSAMKVLYNKKATFISRGDNSGTHAKEMILWKLLNITPKGDWYISAKKDVLTTLKIASEKKAYVLADRSTYLFHKEELNLVIVVEGDSKLFNPYGVIAVSPSKVTGVNYEGAMKFVNFVTSMEGQEVICGYGRLRFNKSLFTPLAIKSSVCK
ncbi:substrate-binding domain-containing protein [Candidatus Magnetomonas plexicatena]|uniref:substrate-binding domain-containing protein n=1 Tax=Candidatus Magnetomonas plexicatena TaxID=2552947 RepID=UPI0011004B19|nr:solute-binding protein [Nitrospirales bacterium LBB_01]